MFTKLLTRRTIQASLKSSTHFPPLQATTSVTKKRSLDVTPESKTKAFHSQAVKIPNTLFFTQLKVEEDKLFPHRKRARFNYKDNYSAALLLPCSNKQLAKKQNDPSALLALAQKNIIEHANRRVDLFFYTLIGYYKTAVFPTSGHTSMQHGRGRASQSNRSITEACHSSFTPSLLDNTIYHKEKVGVKRKSLLSNTHFMDSLNTTVELPSFVNDLDDLLENTCRQKCMEILCDVSLGTINPIEGLTRFLGMMNAVLNDLKQNAEHQSTLSQSSLMKHHPINPKLIGLVLKGTLGTTFSEETRTVTDTYIQLLLRLDPSEKLLCENKVNKEQIYIDKIMSMQDEILHTKSQHQCR